MKRILAKPAGIGKTNNLLKVIPVKGGGRRQRTVAGKRVKALGVE